MTEDILTKDNKTTVLIPQLFLFGKELPPTIIIGQDLRLNI